MKATYLILAIIGLASTVSANSLHRGFNEVKFDRYRLIKADSIEEIEAREAEYFAQEAAHN